MRTLLLLTLISAPLSLFAADCTQHDTEAAKVVVPPLYAFVDSTCHEGVIDVYTTSDTGDAIIRWDIDTQTQAPSPLSVWITQPKETK